MAKLSRDVESLTREAKSLTEKLLAFKKGRDIQRRDHSYAHDWRRGESHKTREPKNAIHEFENELGPAEFIVYDKALRAIARTVDDALRDIRATRADIEAIKTDSDLRADWKTFTGN